MTIAIKQEMKLIFVYLYVTFFCIWLELVHRNDTLTYVTFLQSLTEASLTSQIFNTLFCYYVQCPVNFFDLHPYVPLFALICYTEGQTHFRANGSQIH